jgi:predicted ATP-binding protein involved in virulence
MEVKKITLNNIGLFPGLVIPLSPTPGSPGNITIFIGNNGAGKTSILKSLATSLSWFTARLRTEKGSGNPIPEFVISNSESSASIDLEIAGPVSQREENNQNLSGQIYNWTLARSKKGRKSFFSTNLQGCNRLAGYYRDILAHNPNASLPLIAFYPVERVVLDIPLKIKTKHSFLQLDGYDNSLNQGVDFRRFFEWFREREDTENESGISDEVIQQLSVLIESSMQDVWQRLNEIRASAKDRQLTAVRTAIKRFMPHMDNLRVRRKPRLYMAIDKNGHTLNVAQLSQGEKSLMSLVGDIARRLAMLNPSLENPLDGDGIVMIDEVDLHLHPSWQRSLCRRLSETFPSCQFILTTHSPLVISDTKDLLVYTLEMGEIQRLRSQYGQDANSVLLEAMDTSARNEYIQQKLNDLLDCIGMSQLDDANQLLGELINELSSDHIEIIKAKLLLRKQELRHESNQKGG